MSVFLNAMKKLGKSQRGWSPKYLQQATLQSRQRRKSLTHDWSMNDNLKNCYQHTVEPVTPEIREDNNCFTGKKDKKVSRHL